MKRTEEQMNKEQMKLRAYQISKIYLKTHSAWLAETSSVRLFR